MLISEALNRFLVQLEADGRSSSTIAQYSRHVRQFAHWARDVGHSGDITRISHEDIARFLSSPQARTRANGSPKTATTMNVLRSSLKCFFRYLHEAGYISHNPGRLIRRAACANPPPRALSEKEASKLMATIARGQTAEDRRDHVLFQLMLKTGIRVGSVVGLNVEDVDLSTGTVHLSITKSNRPDQVHLGNEIKKHMRRYLKGVARGPLFTTGQGHRLSCRQIQRRFSEWIKKAEINRAASVHCLRHTLGTILYRQTHDVFLVKEVLRHRSITSTLVYTQPDENRLRQVMRV